MQKRRSIFLYPLSLVYGLITGIRNFLYDAGILKSCEFRIPVICVGNLAVGGTGKTPHTEYLVGLLKKEFTVAVLSRGYKRKSRGFMFAGKTSSVDDIGDEPLQMFMKFPDTTVAVDRNRVHGVREILKERPETNVIILDDGFQHRRITPGFSILLSDYSRLMITDHMLPYGNLRESVRNMRRADIILITKSPETVSAIQRRLIVKEIEKAPYQNLYFTSIIYRKPLPVFEGIDPADDIFPVSEKKDTGVVLVTGIASPEPLEEYLRDRTGELICLAFGDHHTFNKNDIEKIIIAWGSLESSRKYLITTEKDAVRLREFANIADSIRTAFHYIPVGIHFLNDDQEEFDNLIIDYVRKNKRNNRIS
jgi:tetraacyldisaccharide 4'-kinase